MVRELLITLPDRIKLVWRKLLVWLDALALRFIDRYLVRRDEERTLKLLEFDELPILWDFADFAVVPGDFDGDLDSFGGWKWISPIAQDDVDVV